LTVLALWKYKDDPHTDEMIINAIFFITFILFDICWHIFFNTFIYYYMWSNITNTLDSLAHVRKLLILPVLALGYINIAIYVSIVFFVLVLVSGGWFTGYWNFNRKKASAYN
jgi:hypothetical protein